MEIQEEEREVLLSIYDGDEAFKQIDTKTFQYKYGVDESIKSFVLEIKWTENYPNELPNINLDAFYNKHIVPNLKRKIVDLVKEEAEQYIGMSMTYSLFEFIKEKFDELIAEQPENPVDNINIETLTIDKKEDLDEPKKTAKKEILTKAQKRRQWSRLDNKGEKPRGWDWVDIVKHLSQTGNKENSTPNS